MTGAWAILLCAGAGRRFGGGKLTVALEGRPVVAWALDAALVAPVEGVVAVAGADADAVSAALRDAAGAQSGRLTVVQAHDWDEGMAASIRAGVTALPAEATAAVVFLGDMPWVPRDLAGRLLEAIAAGAPASVVEGPGGRPAHPAAFGRDAFGALTSLGGDRGARAVLEGLGEAVVRLSTADPGAWRDVDHPADLAGRSGQTIRPRPDRADG